VRAGELTSREKPRVGQNYDNLEETTVIAWEWV